MEKNITEIIVTIVIFFIFILNLLKVIKLYNKNNIVVTAKIIDKTTYRGCDGEFSYHDYKMEYKIKDKVYKNEYSPYFNRKQDSYIKLIVNKTCGNIITTKLTRNVLIYLLINNSIFPIIMIFCLFQEIFEILNI